MSPADLMEYRIEIEDGNLPAGAVPQQKTPGHLNGFRAPQQFPGNAAYEAADSRNIAARDELARLMRRWVPAPFSQKEFAMRNTILAIAAITGALAAPVAAQAQSTVGVVGGGTVVVDDNGGIAVDQRPAFREYIIRERVPNYTIPDRVIVGGVLPEAGVTYYDVPQTFGATPYRYTVVNGQTVLVEPRSRRIVQVVE
jgi:hypothetical protein